MAKKIYVIDDDPDMTKVMTFRLKKVGYEVESYNSGKEALEKIKGGAPDLILLDVQIPDMTGFEIEDEMNKDEKLKNIPIIFLTGKTDIDSSRGEGKSNRTFFMKPCNFDELTQKVAEMLGSS